MRVVHTKHGLHNQPWAQAYNYKHGLHNQPWAQAYNYKQLWAMGCGLWATGYVLWAIFYGLCAMGYFLWAMCYGLWAMWYGLWAEVFATPQQLRPIANPIASSRQAMLSVRLHGAPRCNWVYIGMLMALVMEHKIGIQVRARV